MTLEGITIAGVDESISPLQLGMLSGEFPFVEWGVLYTPKRLGSVRYPSLDWISRVRKLSAIQPMRLSLHLCGQATRDFSAGTLHPWHEFQRVQMNGWEPTSVVPRALGREIVLQCRELALLDIASDHAEKLTKADDAALGRRVSVLFDRSGGKGIRETEWPSSPGGRRIGYAGGIGADNILNVLDDVSALYTHEAKGRGATTIEKFWLDMESGVRTAEDRIDVEKIRWVLKMAQDYL